MYAFCPLPPACVRTKWKPQRWLPTGKVNANRNNGTVYIGCCTEGGGGFWFCNHLQQGGGGEIATFTWFTMAWQALWLNTWPLGILILNCGWPMLSHIWILATPLFHRFQNTLGPIPQIPHYIVTYSTASIIDCDLFYCFDNWLGPIPQLPHPRWWLYENLSRQWPRMFIKQKSRALMSLSTYPKGTKIVCSPFELCWLEWFLY